MATARIDTPEELVAFRHGGILPYVLRQLAHGSSYAAMAGGWSTLTIAALDLVSGRQARGGRRRLRSLRHRAGRDFPSSGSCASGSIAATPARCTTCTRSAERRADVRHVLPSARSVIVARHGLQHRSSVFDRDRRARDAPPSRATPGATTTTSSSSSRLRRLVDVAARERRGGLRGARLRRHRAGAGARLRAVRRVWAGSARTRA